MLSKKFSYKCIKNVFLTSCLSYHKINKSGQVKPNCVDEIPVKILRPNYSFLQIHSFKGYQVFKDATKVGKFSETCSLAKHVLKVAKSLIEPGVTTEYIDDIVHKEIISCGAYPSPLNYRGFPKSCCTSVNNVVCHGIPNDYTLQSSDIINIDISVYYNGYHGDTSDTFHVGHIDPVAKRLIEITRYSLQEAIKECKPGKLFSDIGKRIENISTENNFSVCKRFTGHGIGKYFHTSPTIYHYWTSSKKRMLTGLAFTIEPILINGKDKVRTLEDGWTEVTCDGSLSAQSEHTLIITEDGCQVLT